MTPLHWQWAILILFGLFFLAVSPFARSAKEFYRAASPSGRPPGAVMLTSSLVIAWIFAKSITNAANLGLEFGLVGGVAYACYYLSFLTGGIVLYRMRTRGGFESIHHFLRTRYGAAAVRSFTLLIVFRLYNEVWSNTIVIGTYFGAPGSGAYYWAIIAFTTLILAYTLKGGLRTSLITDAIQMGFFGVLLCILLGVILPGSGHSAEAYLHSGTWTMAGGVSLLCTALLQVFSYPFHDPILTDRAFISTPRTTLRSYIAATVVGFVCILLFSAIGIFARLQGIEGQASVEVSKGLGVGVMLAMNLIMITSAASCVDSTFASFAKLIVVDLGRFKTAPISKGRLAMAALAVLGTVPVFFNASILSATTVSGTMVIGLAPVFLFWNRKMPASSFQLSVWAGVAAGGVLAAGLFPKAWAWFDGKHGDLLTVNILGSLLCFALFFLPLVFRHGRMAPADDGAGQA